VEKRATVVGVESIGESWHSLCRCPLSAVRCPLSALGSPYRRDKGEGRKRHASERDDEPLPLPTCILFLRGCRHCRHCRHLPKTLRSEPCAGVEWTQWSEKVSRWGHTSPHITNPPCHRGPTRLARSQTTPLFLPRQNMMPPYSRQRQRQRQRHNSRKRPAVQCAQSCVRRLLF